MPAYVIATINEPNPQQYDAHRRLAGSTGRESAAAFITAPVST